METKDKVGRVMQALYSIALAMGDLEASKIKASNNVKSFGDKRKRGKNKDEWTFIPKSPGFVLTSLELALTLLSKNNQERKFIDVGCGFPWIPVLASKLGFYSFGLEKFPFFQKIGNHLLPNGRFIKADMFKFNRYSEFNCIYHYEPIACEVKMKKFRELLTSRIKPNTVIIVAGYTNYYETHKDYTAVNGDKDSFARIYIYKSTLNLNTIK